MSLGKVADKDNPHLGKKTLIIWDDASKRHGDHEFEDKFNPKFRISTLGFFIGEDSSHIWIAEDVNIEEDWCRDISVIPKAMIVKRRFLR